METNTTIDQGPGTEQTLIQVQSKGFYEQKGMIRHMIILPEGHKVKLKRISKIYSLTQGEVIEVMLNQIDLDQIGCHFAAKKADKSDGRANKTELIKKIKDLTPTQINAINAIIASTQN